MVHRLVLAVFTAFVTTSSSATNDFAQEFLSQFGYLPSSEYSSSQSTPEMLSDAILDYQMFMKLKPTGILDSETIEMMEAPRCGIPDRIWGSGDRYKRGVTSGTKWKTTDLTYKVSQYGSRLSQEETDRALREAFDVWESVTPLTFARRTGGSVNFDIRFERGNHSSYCTSFDGRGKVLAHAFFPPKENVKPTYHGNTHFDDEEIWTMESRGINLFQVAVHEIGHAIGLKHSDVPGAVMFPSYRYQANFKLHQDDIDTIQMVYGKPDRKRADRMYPTGKPPGQCMCICNWDKMWYLDKIPGLVPGKIEYETPQFPYYEPKSNEVPLSAPYYQPTVDETPQSTNYAASVDETPQSSDYAATVDETHQSPNYAATVDETYQSPNYASTVDETYQSPDYAATVGETHQSPNYAATVDETHQSPDYAATVDETHPSPNYAATVDETQQSPDYAATMDETQQYPY